jgi:hypothetical protein
MIIFTGEIPVESGGTFIPSRDFPAGFREIFILHREIPASNGFRQNTNSNSYNCKVI